MTDRRNLPAGAPEEERRGSRRRVTLRLRGAERAPRPKKPPTATASFGEKNPDEGLRPVDNLLRAIGVECMSQENADTQKHEKRRDCLDHRSAPCLAIPEREVLRSSR